MKKNKNFLQLTLIFIGIFLIIITYFFYPLIYQNKLTKKESLQKENIEIIDETGDAFENVEYIGSYNINNSFVIRMWSICEGQLG